MANKTPSYTRKAIDNYNAKYDRITVNLPKGAADQIRNKTDKSPAAWCREILIAALEQLEAGTDQEQTTTE